MRIHLRAHRLAAFHLTYPAETPYPLAGYRVRTGYHPGLCIPSMPDFTKTAEQTLRQALDSKGQRYTAQRASVYSYLISTDAHPTADEVFLHVRESVPGISLATVYKSLETLVGCGLAVKLAYADGSARYDGRTDDHHHLRCVSCGSVMDLPGRADDREVARLAASAEQFRVTGYRLELTGYCNECASPSDTARTA